MRLVAAPIATAPRFFAVSGTACLPRPRDGERGDDHSTTMRTATSVEDTPSATTPSRTAPPCECQACPCPTLRARGRRSARRRFAPRGAAAVLASLVVEGGSVDRRPPDLT